MAHIIITSSDKFERDALDELKLIAPKMKVEQQIAPGVQWVRVRSADKVSGRWRETPPTFVRHLCQTQVVVSLTGETSDIEQLQTELRRELVDFILTSSPFSVQTRIFGDVSYKPFAVNEALSRVVKRETGAKLDVRDPLQVVSVVIGQFNGSLVGWMGVSPVEDNLSDWAGGVRRFKRDKEQISRSEFKLLEALAVLPIKLPGRGRALDLGAAPGGWTRILRQQGDIAVVAVDAAELHPSLSSDWGVWHAQVTADHYLRDHKSRQADDTFDLIVNDMHVDAGYSAHLMIGYAKLLKSTGQALVTIKLPTKGHKEELTKALTQLSTAYEIKAVRHLFHNRWEVTTWLAPLP